MLDKITIIHTLDSAYSSDLWAHWIGIEVNTIVDRLTMEIHLTIIVSLHESS